MELIDTIKYFAKFPSRDGVIKCFSNPVPDPEYLSLQNYISNLEGNGLIPDIEDFIVSSDEKAIAEKIKNIEGYFMYLEYAGIQSTAPDQMRNRNTDSTFAIIVAHHNNSRNTDNMYEAIIMDKCLAYIKQMWEYMKADDAEVCGNKRLTDSAISIQPIPAVLLYQSYGWELAIRKTNNLLL